MVNLEVPDAGEVADHDGPRPTVQVKYVDTNDGGLWVTWRWEHALDRPRIWGIQPPQVAGALDAFRQALPTPGSGETVRDALRRSWRVLGDAMRERQVSGALAAALVPAPLGAELDQFLLRGKRPHLRIQASPALAAVPWEALRADDGGRLVQSCDVSGLLPASVRGSAARLVTPPRPGGTVVATVNPVVPGEIDGLGPVTRRSEPLLESMLAALGDRLRGPAEGPVRSHVNREQLREMLATAARYLYVGHARSGAYALATSLHLTDGPEAQGRAPLVGGLHRPLTAADIALDGSWVVPSRVALLACASGGDAAYADPAGLVAAFTMRGAEYVTAARWTLPTDAGVEMLATASGPDPDATPAQNLARAVVAVDAAHESTDPVATLGAWQRDQADAWDRTGDPAYSPVVWAALTTAWS